MQTDLTTSGKLPRLFHYIKPYRQVMFLGLALMLATVFLMLKRTLLLRQIIDNAAGSKDLDIMYWHSALFVFIIVTCALFTYLQNMMIGQAGLKMIAAIKSDVFEHCIRLPVKFFNQHKVGWLISRVEGDTEELKHFCTGLTLRIVADLITFVGILVTMFVIDATVAIRILPMLVLFVWMILGFRKRISDSFQKARRVSAELSGAISEYLQAIQLIQIYDRRAQVENELQRRSKERFKAENYASLLSNTFWAVFLFLTEGVMIAVLVYYGALQVVQAQMSIGTLVMLLEFARQMVQPLHAIGEHYNALQKATVAANRVFGILTQPLEASASETAAPTFSSLQFEHVGFAYEANKPVLRDLNFTLDKGSVTALVGASGGGKSTTIQLICRFLEPTAGRILWNGEPFQTYNLHSCRKKIGLVLQDVFLFPGTIYENISLMDPAINRDQVQRALEIIGAMEILNRFPNGIDAELSERGNNLSLGERQLLSFARALVQDPEIMILDEATASLDHATEQVLQEAMKVIMMGRTSIVIAHRLSTIRDADQILVLEQGALLEAGSHDDLMQSGGRYQELVEKQTGRKFLVAAVGEHHG